MTFSQVYATTVLPGLLAWTILRLTAYFGADDILAWGATLVIFLASAYLGYEVEHHYFREVCVVADKNHRRWDRVTLGSEVFKGLLPFVGEGGNSTLSLS